MLWKDFKQKECCDGCPLLENELCNCHGDIVCYGGEPIEPPCCNFDDETDLDKWVDDIFAQRRRREEAEDKRLKAEQEKKDRAKKATDTRRAMHRSLSAADVAPVVHGHWRKSKEGVCGDYLFVCSACGADYWESPSYCKQAHYCPNCGAKMD